ncbi:DUF1302 domain-containing protein [Pseudomonas sp. R5(2019)]|uniref:DUF1302 domain-containing protein n=1 Tax=Pseudomonas sp. R5(2019) TaxID=2697566 RepID=UPI001412A2A4|nr:DUF1302 domain-containing protein [Pseudomonas sp. R5(2019)]NBA94297.1 DUF1302 family protein [Pseudomonas sp. R5(2019)]
MRINPARALLRLAPARAGFTFAGLLIAAPASAVEFRFLDGEVQGSLDTTVSYGQLWRVQGRDETNDDININDGNRNFDTGLVSEVYKITSDLEASYRNYGLFVRGSAFYDTQIMDKGTAFNDNNMPIQPSQNFPRNNRFTKETRDHAGRRAEILDAYVHGNWQLGDMPLTARAGRQVFNWGEGLFYRGGVNTTNPINAARFRLPGAELKEVLVPVEALNFNLGLTENLSLETFYQFNWKETAVDPVGTFFSETDLFADGGNTAYATLPALTPLSNVYSGLSAVGAGGLQGGRTVDAQGNIKVASIGPDINARDDGQFGAAMRYVAPSLNSTEFGFYFVNYHAKEPTIYADLGSYAGLDFAELTAAVEPGFQQAIADQAGISVQLLQAILAAFPNSPQAQAYRQGLAQTVGGLATIDVANQVNGRRHYSEDIRMFGFTFNTTLGDASVFGELAYRPNMPIGVATTSDLLGDLLLQAPQMASGGVVNIGGKDVSLRDQVNNRERVEMFNASLGTIYNFGPTLGFSNLTAVAEVASEHLRGSSLEYTAFDGTRRKYSSRANVPYIAGFKDSAQVTPDAYGGTLMLIGTWNDVFAGVNLSPFAIYKDDFKGNSHQTGNFIEGRKAYSLGLKASYQNAFEAELQYTEFYGGGQASAIRDRDNVGLNLKYSF